VKTFARCCANLFVVSMLERAQLESVFLSGGMAIVGRLNILWLSITKDHQMLNLQYRV